MNKFSFLLIICILIASCQNSNPGTDQSDNSPSKSTTSNAKMVSLLKKVYDEADPEETLHLNTKRAEKLKTFLQANQSANNLGKYFELGVELLNAGKTKEAISQLKVLIDLFEKEKQPITEQSKLLYEHYAVAYLRLGEEENCCAAHNDESCIIPIKGKAIHKIRRGSENAIKIYERILTAFPDDLQSKYLLNIAYMTLGEYPQNVPTAHLIKNLGAKSEKEFPKFKDKAISSGVDTYGLSGGCVVDDFDNDGLLDIIASSYGMMDQLRYYHNEGNGKYKEMTVEAQLEGIVSGLNTKQADYNNDGYLDLLILRGAWLDLGGEHPNSLLRNNGDNTFTDVTEEAGLLSFHPTQTAAWRDFNQDGWIDLFIGNETASITVHPCELFINNGDGTFTDQAEEAGMHITSYIKGVTAGDINNDGYPDIFMSNLNGDNFLMLNTTGSNNGKVSFGNIATEAGVVWPKAAFPCWMWDYNNDGNEDIFVSSYDLKGFDKMSAHYASELLGKKHEAEYPKVYKNLGSRKFEDVTEELDMKKLLYAMGSNYGDLNNDGFLDFYVGNGAPDFRMIIPNRVFLNLAADKFVDITTNGGFGNIQKGHAVSFADIDNDGDQDIYCVMGGAVEGDTYHNLLYENPGFGNNWICLQLEGTTSNRSAIGARIKVVVQNQNKVEKSFFYTVSSGGSFGGSSLRQEIGLGKDVTIKYIDILWPNKANERSKFTNVPINKFYKIKEGESQVQEISVQKFNFNS